MIFEQYKRDFMKRNIIAAEEAGVPMPTHAAAAAALESGFGTIEAYISWNNPFNVKMYGHPKHGLHFVPSSTFEGKAGWSQVSEAVSFDTLVRCYATIRESIEALDEDWPADNAADVQLEDEADALAASYHALIRGLTR